MAAATTAGKLSDYLVLVTPIGVVSAAVITSRVAKRSPYDRLELLLGMLKSWPAGVEGRETVVRSIELTLAEIRIIEGQTNHDRTVDELAYDKSAARKLQGNRSVLSLGLFLVGLFYILMGIWMWGRDEPTVINLFTIAIGVVACVLPVWQVLRRKRSRVHKYFGARA